MSGRPQLPEIDKAKRTARILALRAQGKSYRYIADEVGLSFQQVSNIIKAELANMSKPDIELLRKTEMFELEGLEQVAYAILEKHHYKISPTGKLVALPKELGEDYAEDPTPVLQAINTIKGLKERKAKLLGLDAPVKADVTYTEITELDRTVAEWINEDKAREAAGQRPTSAEVEGIDTPAQTHTEA